MRTTIQIHGARENNLQNVDVEIPRDKLIVVTGMSGSGKSSLAFDTIYAEGQRRLLASMSTFAKRFVGQLKKPDVDFVNGLSPVVSIDQKTVGSNPRSTVGTMTDISDYLRMLFATMGTPHCPLCGEALAIRTPHQMMEHLLSLPKGTEVEVRAPVYKIHGEDYEYLFEQIRVNGYRRARIDGKPRDLGDHIELDEDEEHTVEAVIDSFVVGPGIDQQVVTSLEHGLKLGDGLLGFHIVKPKQLGRRAQEVLRRLRLRPASARRRRDASRSSSRSTTPPAPARPAPASARPCACIRRCSCPIRSDVERGSVRHGRAEQQPRQLGRPAAVQPRRPLRIQPRYALSRIWPRSTCRCCSTAPRGNSSKSSCRRGRSRGSSTPARRSSSTASSINWSITIASTASRARRTPAWTST